MFKDYITEDLIISFNKKEHRLSFCEYAMINRWDIWIIIRSIVSDLNMYDNDDFCYQIQNEQNINIIRDWLHIRENAPEPPKEKEKIPSKIRDALDIMKFALDFKKELNNKRKNFNNKYK